MPNIINPPTVAVARKAFAATFIMLLTIGSCVAGNDPASPIGTNINAVSDFSDEFPFVNLMKSARDWIPGNLAGCFDCREPGSNPACNAPNSCPVMINRDADGYVTSLQPNQTVTTIVHAGGTPGRLSPGNYTVRFEGAGSFQLLGATGVSQIPGEVVVNVASSTGNNIGVRLTAITAGNHVRNIRILPPGGVCSNDDQRFCDAAAPCGVGASCQLFTTPGVSEAQLFQPRFLQNHAPFRLLRFMDWMGTNSSPVVNTADYPTESSAFWGRVPITVLAKLGNRLRSDLWINIPHLASDSFIDAIATSLRDNHISDRKIYLEYGNENWNGIFSQNIEIPRQFCAAFADLAAGCQNDGIPGNGISCERDPNTFSLGAAQGPCFQALVRAWGDRSVQIFERFDSAFGASARQRLVRVIAAQAANADLGRQVLARNATGQAFSVATKTDSYASAPYFGTEYCTPDSSTAFLDSLETQGLNRARGFMTSSKAMLSTNFAALGIRHISYEGGQHLAGIGGFTFNATCNQRFDEANRSPRMEQIYRTYLSDWKANGDEFTQFYSVGRYSVFGRWGLLEFQDQTPSSAPKFVAMTGHATANPCHWPNCVQPTAVSENLFRNGFEGN